MEEEKEEDMESPIKLQRSPSECVQTETKIFNICSENPISDNFFGKLTILITTKQDNELIVKKKLKIFTKKI